MKKIIEEIDDVLKKAFKDAGYDEKYGCAKWSDRPDLCEFQCNGAMSAAKEYHKAPALIAEDVVKKISADLFRKTEVVKPGFINIDIDPEALADFTGKMASEDKFGYEEEKEKKTAVIDYGGPNVAKPLHVGHLRSAVIGESLKRILRYSGEHVIGDAHLGDWGLQIGLIITELKKRQPDLVYFDENYTGDYPEEPPFTISDLEEIYPCANTRSKEDPEFKEEAQKATAELQAGRRGYRALWQHIINVSVTDLKRIYKKLNVDFDLWKKESDSQPYISDMVDYMKKEGYAHIDDGALVVDVAEEGDKKKIPPCMILKSNGATLYNTTDLATIVERKKLFNPDRIVYVVDKRQSLYFEQVFRCARKTKLVDPHVDLVFIGFGTMNGKDGKPFKTRDGGVLRLEVLIKEVYDKVMEKMKGRDMTSEEAEDAARKITIAAIKYGDLSNQASKNYIFDIDRFTSFEGNTGPYILYTMVRIKSLLKKAGLDYASGAGSESAAGSGSAAEARKKSDAHLLPPASESETKLMLSAVRWMYAVESAVSEYAPHKICQFIYELAENYNIFYHENKILAEADEKQKNSWLELSRLVLGLLNAGTDLLGIECPERM